MPPEIEDTKALDAALPADPVDAGAAPEPVAADPAPEPKSALDALNEVIGPEPIEGNKGAEGDDADEIGSPEPAVPVAKEKEKTAAPTDKTLDPKAAPEAPAAAVDSEEVHKLPIGLNREQRASWKKLSDHARTLDAEKADVAKRFEETDKTLGTFREIVKDSKATGEQMAGMFGYLHALNSGDGQLALQMLEQERTALARRLGVKLEGVDAFGDFPDIKAKLDAMEIDEATAQEVAAARRVRQQADAQAQQQRTAAEAAETVRAREKSSAKAMGDVAAFVKIKQGSDLDYAWKDQQVTAYLSKPQTAAILQKLAPEDWLAHIEAFYDSLTPPRSAPTPRDPQPLRPRNSGGPMNAQPKNSLEAFDHATGYRN